MQGRESDAAIKKSFTFKQFSTLATSDINTTLSHYEDIAITLDAIDEHLIELTRGLPKENNHNAKIKIEREIELLKIEYQKYELYQSKLITLLDNESTEGIQILRKLIDKISKEDKLLTLLSHPFEESLNKILEKKESPTDATKPPRPSATTTSVSTSNKPSAKNKSSNHLSNDNEAAYRILNSVISIISINDININNYNMLMLNNDGSLGVKHENKDTFNFSHQSLANVDVTNLYIDDLINLLRNKNIRAKIDQLNIKEPLIAKILEELTYKNNDEKFDALDIAGGYTHLLRGQALPTQKTKERYSPTNPLATANKISSKIPNPKDLVKAANKAIKSLVKYQEFVSLNEKTLKDLESTISKAKIPAQLIDILQDDKYKALFELSQEYKKARKNVGDQQIKLLSQVLLYKENSGQLIKITNNINNNKKLKNLKKQLGFNNASSIEKIGEYFENQDKNIINIEHIRNQLFAKLNKEYRQLDQKIKDLQQSDLPDKLNKELESIRLEIGHRNINDHNMSEIQNKLKSPDEIVQSAKEYLEHIDKINGRLNSISNESDANNKKIASPLIANHSNVLNEEIQPTPATEAPAMQTQTSANTQHSPSQPDDEHTALNLSLNIHEEGEHTEVLSTVNLIALNQLKREIIGNLTYLVVNKQHDKTYTDTILDKIEVIQTKIDTKQLIHDTEVEELRSIATHVSNQVNQVKQVIQDAEDNKKAYTALNNSTHSADHSINLKPSPAIIQTPAPSTSGQFTTVNSENDEREKERAKRTQEELARIDTEAGIRDIKKVTDHFILDCNQITTNPLNRNLISEASNLFNSLFEEEKEGKGSTNYLADKKYKLKPGAEKHLKEKLRDPAVQKSLSNVLNIIEDVWKNEEGSPFNVSKKITLLREKFPQLQSISTINNPLKNDTTSSTMNVATTEKATKHVTQQAAEKAEQDAAATKSTQEAAAKKAEQDATAKKSAQEAAAKKAERDAAAKKSAQEAAAKKAEQDAAAKKSAQEAAAKKAEQDAAAKKSAQEAAAKKAEQDAAAKKSAQEAAAKKAEQDAAATKSAQEAAAKKAEQDAAAKKSAQEAAAKKAEQDAAAKKTAQAPVAKKAEQDAAAMKTTQAPAAKKTEQDTVAMKTAQAPAAKKAEQDTAAMKTAQAPAAKKTEQDTVAKKATEKAAGEATLSIRCYSDYFEIVHKNDVKSKITHFTERLSNPLNAGQLMQVPKSGTTDVFGNNKQRINITNAGTHPSTTQIITVQKIENGKYTSDIHFNVEKINKLAKEECMKASIKEIENFLALPGTSKEKPIQISGDFPDNMVKAMATYCQQNDIKYQINIDRLNTYNPTIDPFLPTNKVAPLRSTIIDKHHQPVINHTASNQAYSTPGGRPARS